MPVPVPAPKAGGSALQCWPRNWPLWAAEDGPAAGGQCWPALEWDSPGIRSGSLRSMFVLKPHRFGQVCDRLATLRESQAPPEKPRGTVVTGGGRMSKIAPEGRIWADAAVVLETNPQCAHLPSSREPWGPAVPLHALVGQTDQSCLFSVLNALVIKGCKHLEDLRDSVRSLKALSGLVRAGRVQNLPLPGSIHPCSGFLWLLHALMVPEPVAQPPATLSPVTQPPVCTPVPLCRVSPCAGSASVQGSLAELQQCH